MRLPFQEPVACLVNRLNSIRYLGVSGCSFVFGAVNTGIDLVFDLLQSIVVLCEKALTV